MSNKIEHCADFVCIASNIRVSSGSMSLKIEKGIPRRVKRKYPFESMKKGESFFQPSAKTRSTMSSILSLARRYHPELKFETAAETVGRQSGVRCWRVA